MSQFQRETRYAVFKLKHLTEEQKQRLYDFSMELGPYNSVKECVVVESDWPNYEDTWAAIQAVHNGCYVPAAKMPDGMILLGRRITELSAQLHEATFQCPNCKGPHFNVTVGGKILCASVTEKTDYEVKAGGCGWSGFIEIKHDAGAFKAGAA